MRQLVAPERDRVDSVITQAEVPFGYECAGKIVAFSGEHEYGGIKVTEASLNGFPSGQISDKIQAEPYRFLVCADKFQTGYD